MKKIFSNKYIILCCTLSCYFLFVGYKKIVSPKSYHQAISLLGEKSHKFESVINHYKKKPSDSLKLKAAYFLISNIPFNGSKNGFFSSGIMENLISKYRQEQIKKGTMSYWDLTYSTQDRFSTIADSLEKTTVKINNELLNDADVIDANYLIENIDLAFLAYNKIPDNYKVNFEDFCDYVLPYREGKEPIESGKRKELFLKYSWVYEDLKTKPFEEVVSKIYTETGRLQTSAATFRDLNGSLGYSQLEKIGLGRCGDLVNYYVHLFRALGIASGSEYNTSWGNRHHSSGHSWFFVKYADKIIPTETGTRLFTPNSESLKVSSMPKVFRKRFKKVDEYGSLIRRNDVTSLYRKTSNIKIENLFLDAIQNKKIYLCVFKNLSFWKPVSDDFSIENNYVKFNNVARGILYALVYFDETNKMTLVNNPFYLKFSGAIDFLAPSDKRIDTSFILRKDAPFLPQVPNKIPRMRSANACVLQGSNSLKGKFHDIYDINKHNSTQNIKYKLSTKKRYKYYRLSCSEESVHLANFKLLSTDLNPINKYKNTFSKSKFNWGQTLENVIDSNPLTYIEVKNLEIIYEVDNGQKIGGFEIQTRNDDNHINIGEKYKLFIWDKNWKTIDTRVANDTVLTYKNLPAHSLYYLRNLTKGKEETLFTLDRTGKQFWFSVSDINEIQ